MTPEQDKELREAILLEFKNVHRLAPADYTENCTNIVMQLITADRKRVALEARVAELEKFVNTTNRSLSVKKLRDRLSELKAQQEEV
jgi:hypothetical protein